MTKHSIDKDIPKFAKFQKGIRKENRGVVNIGLAFLFLLGVWAFVSLYLGEMDNKMIVVLAGVIGGYMAMNIGANDVANNIGPAVGSKALTMGGALLIAAVFEASGAILAGGDVVSTIRKGIIDPDAIGDVQIFIYAMMAALLAAALWINLATIIGAPVSTTHSVVGGVVGAGIAAAGFSAVNWGTMGGIALSWVVSPVLGGMVAALFLYFIKHMILFKEDKVSAAKKWVPVLVGVLVAAFGMYMAMKGLKKIWKIDTMMVWVTGGIGFFVGYLFSYPLIAKASKEMENRKKAVAQLFTIPLIFSAALLSFAHGANDVANAIGPLSAIVSAVEEGGLSSKVAVPMWVMFVGGAGIAVGLFLFGPKLIKKVGSQITKLNQIRAFCVSLAAAITVIAASWMGMPVSSTHIAVGAIFGVGFLREYLANTKNAERVVGLDAYKGQTFDSLEPDDKRKYMKAKKRKLVRRNHVFQIAAAWVITVPAAALLSGGIFYAIKSMAGV